MPPFNNANARIRDATVDDLPSLVELLQQLSIDTPREDLSPDVAQQYRATFAEIEADPRQRLLVLEADGGVVGSLVLIVIPNLSHQCKPYALVENVIVDEAMRGSGYGEHLMRFAIDEARRAGCYKLSLTSNKRRADAHRFYQRLGLAATSEGFRIDLD
jgi:GNAT superfamily N-acetyltransferase